MEMRKTKIVIISEIDDSGRDTKETVKIDVTGSQAFIKDALNNAITETLIKVHGKDPSVANAKTAIAKGLAFATLVHSAVAHLEQTAAKGILGKNAGKVHHNNFAEAFIASIKQYDGKTGCVG